MFIVRRAILDAIATTHAPFAVSQPLCPSLHLSHTPYLDAQRHNKLAGPMLHMCRIEEQGLRDGP